MRRLSWVCGIYHVKHILGIKSLWIGTSFTSCIGAKPFKGVVEQIMPPYTCATPTKIGIRHIRIAFPHVLYAYYQENFRNGIQ